MLTRETDPVTPAVEAGEKATLKVAVAPAAMVVGVVRPLILKPVPETVACEIVTLAVPLFFKKMLWETGSPMTTLPKLRLAGAGVS